MQIVLPENYHVIANYNDRYVLAFNGNPGAVEPWVVWNIGFDGRPHTGCYCGKKECAEKKFAALCFDWFVMEEEVDR